MKHSLLTLLILISASLALAACTNTVRGVGQDFEKAGQEIQKSTH